MLCVQQKDWRMHQNMHFKTQKFKKKWGWGSAPFSEPPSGEGDIPSLSIPHHHYPFSARGPQKS